MATPIKIKGIEFTVHAANQYTRIDLYLTGINGRIAQIQREVHLVDNFKANLLLEIDVLASKKITIDFSAKIATVKSCDLIEIPLFIETRSLKVSKTIFF